MAITRVGVMANPPTNIGDYTHILAHLDAYAKQVGNQGMLLTQWGNASGVPAIAKGSYISHGGTLFVVDTEDFLVAAPASNGTYYLRVAGSGASLAISWVTSIGGYTWNAIYNGLYDGSENQILPYMLIKTGAVLEKWKISNLMQGGNFNRVDYLGRVIMGALASLAVTGAISGASLDTGSGAMTFDQGVKTTDSVVFANINPPIDNSSAVMPQVGIGGFTYAVSTYPVENSGAKIWIPTTGIFIVHIEFDATPLSAMSPTTPIIHFTTRQADGWSMEITQNAPAGSQLRAWAMRIA